jgi:hypothetical protein
MKKFLYPGGMTDEAVSNAVDVTIQTMTLRIHLGKFCSGRRFSEIESRSSGIPPGFKNFAFLVRGIVADAPQPPANICDPSRVKNAVGEST